ncbi:LytTR family transcriptional regulator DNA-binding domain-containing protein [Crocinitomicaceae bacterium]|nr:LytTR family transcriptional regulator DNA-binding domain-containing protein [Crocinitomicaceae bacterium]
MKYLYNKYLNKLIRFEKKQQLLPILIFNVNTSFIIIFATLLIFPFLSVAQNESDFLDQLASKEKIKFNFYTKIYETDDIYTVRQIDSLIKKEALPISLQVVSQGFSQKFYWLYFKIPRTKYPKEQLLLELNNPFIDLVELYEKTDTSFTKIGFGGDRNRAFSDRNYINRRFIFPVNNNPKAIGYYLMIDKRNASVSFPMYLWNKSTFENFEIKQNLYYGIFFGVLCFVSFLAIIAGIITRSSLFLYYGTYTFFIILYLFTTLGFSYQYLYPQSHHFNNYSRVILIVLITVSITLFLNKFLNIATSIPVIVKAFKIINILLTTSILSWIYFTDLYQSYTVWLLNIIYILIFCVFILAFIAAFKTYKTKKTNAIVFFIAFSFPVLGAIAYIGIEYGIIEESFFPLNPIFLGVGLEVIILSVAIINQFFKMYDQKVHFENENLLLSSSNETLKELSYDLVRKLNTKSNPTILLKSKAVLKIEDIQYITSDGPYLEFFMTTKTSPEIDRQTLKWALNILPSDSFIQIHRSYIINLKHVKVLKASELILFDNTILKVSRSFKKNIEHFKSQ